MVVPPRIHCYIGLHSHTVAMVTLLRVYVHNERLLCYKYYFVTSQEKKTRLALLQEKDEEIEMLKV